MSGFSYKYSEIEKLVLNENPNALAMKVLGLRHLVCKNEQRIKHLEYELKECGKYAAIIKIGLNKNDARYLEAEQIERIVKKALEKNDKIQSLEKG